MAELKRHWTERSIEDYLFKVSADFVRQLQAAMGTRTTQAALAETLGVSKGRISQVLNNPGNLTLRKMIEYTRALGHKVAVVAYDDDDPSNTRGPVSAEIFVECWRIADRPLDNFDLSESVALADLNRRPRR